MMDPKSNVLRCKYIILHYCIFFLLLFYTIIKFKTVNVLLVFQFSYVFCKHLTADLYLFFF